MIVYVLCMFKGVTVILVTFSRIFYISYKLVVLISCLVYLLGLVDLMIRKHFIGFVVQFLVKSGSSLMKEINDLLLNIVVLTYSRYECQILLHFLFRLKFCLLQVYYWLYTLFNVTHYILDYLSGSSTLASVIVMCFDELNIGLVNGGATKLYFTHYSVCSLFCSILI